MSTKKLQIVSSIVKFIKGEVNADEYDKKSKESLQLVLDCLESIYNTSADDCENAEDLYKIMNKPKVPIDTAKAEVMKAKGNELMTSNKTNEAIDAYSQAIHLDPTNPVYFGNRAAAYIKLKKYTLAIEDSLESIYLDPKYHKGYARAGTAYAELEENEKAIPYFEEAVKLAPNDKSYQDRLAICKGKAPNTSSGLGGNMDFAQIMNNPEFLNMANNLMQNPDMQRIFGGFVENLSGAAGAGAGAGAGGLDPSSIAQAVESMANTLKETNPESLNKLKDVFKGNHPPPS